MALFTRPEWAPIPEPPAPDPADYTECQSLAAAILPADDTALDQAGLDLADASAAINDGEAGLESLGLDLAAGIGELDAIAGEAAADDLAAEIEAGNAAAATLEDAANDIPTVLIDSLGNPVPGATPEFTLADTARPVFLQQTPGGEQAAG